jgi:hypothetical protein
MHHNNVKMMGTIVKYEILKELLFRQINTIIVNPTNGKYSGYHINSAAKRMLVNIMLFPDEFLLVNPDFQMMRIARPIEIPPTWPIN